jgi:DNA-binding LacI/PurR family transcriptional regulator
MTSKRTRLVDVAKAAGVSIGAASDALSGKNRIPEATRNRIREIANNLGYVPNPIARALTTGHLPLVGLVISAIDRRAEFDAYRTYWADVIGAATLAAANRGYALVVLATLDSFEIQSIPFAGLIVVDPTTNDPDLEDALALNIPVATDYLQTDERIAVKFRAEYGDSVGMALNHLVKEGAHKCAVIMPSVDDAVWVQNVEHYAIAWSDATNTSVDCFHLPVDSSENELALEDILQSGFDGIYSLMPTDEFMQAFDEAIDHKNKTIGKDLHLVMLDEDRTGALAQRGISVAGVSPHQYAQSIVTALIDVIERTKEHDQVKIEFRLTEA